MSPEPRHVLVVEDYDQLRSTTAAILTLHGFRVTRVSSAAEALAMLADGEPIDVVFSHVGLSGGCSGLALYQIIRRQWPDIPVILTSGGPVLFEALPDNVSARPPILAKPYRMAELVERVEAALKAAA